MFINKKWFHIKSAGSSRGGGGERSPGWGVLANTLDTTPMGWELGTQTLNIGRRCRFRRLRATEGCARFSSCVNPGHTLKTQGGGAGFGDFIRTSIHHEHDFSWGIGSIPAKN